MDDWKFTMAQARSSEYSQDYLHEYNGHLIISWTLAFIVLQTLFLTLRFYSRYIAKVVWGVDDTLLIAGALFSYALQSCALGESLHNTSFFLYLL
jgi:hypothetical protein